MFFTKIISRFPFGRISSSLTRQFFLRNYSFPSITTKDGCYRIVLNLSRFSLEEIKVRTGFVTTVNVEATQKHESEGGGFSFNHVNMQYVVPITHNGEKLDAKLDEESGVLVLTAPKTDKDLNEHFKPVEITKEKIRLH